MADKKPRRRVRRVVVNTPPSEEEILLHGTPLHTKTVPTPETTPQILAPPVSAGYVAVGAGYSPYAMFPPGCLPVLIDSRRL